MSYVKRLIEIRNNQRRRKKSRPDAIIHELQQFEQGWTSSMVAFWRERIARLGINDTQALYNSLQGVLHPGPPTTIEHSFLIYGLYVSEGVGREFGTGYTDSLGRTYSSSRGEGTINSGQLPFLLPGGEEYRREHKLDEPKKVGPAWGGRVAGGHPREKDDWYWRKYYASRMVLNEVEAAAYGTAYQGMLTRTLGAVISQKIAV